MDAASDPALVPTPVRPRSLTLPHALLALAVVAIWGANFTIIKIALLHLPPLFMATLRFALAVVPCIFFVPRPSVPWRRLAIYGGSIGAGQFGLIFIAINGFISPGLASLVVQCQIFFTIGLAVMLRGEHVRPMQWLSLALGVAGLGVIMAHTGADATLTGVLLVLGAGLFWAIGNIASASNSGVNMLAFIVWSSLFAVPPLLIASLLVEGPAAMAAGLAGTDAVTWACVLWQTVGNTLFGYGAWAFLMARYPAATIVPTALLIPVFGLGVSALVLGEALPVWKLGACALVIAGLALNMLVARRR